MKTDRQFYFDASDALLTAKPNLACIRMNSAHMKHLILFLLFIAVSFTVHASLLVTADEPRSTGNKAVVKLTMQNTYTNTVASARAAVFLLDDNGKVVGQTAQWVIGGTKDKPALAPGGSSVYYVTVPADKPFKKTKVMFTRIILEGGKVIEAGKGFELKQ